MSLLSRARLLVTFGRGVTRGVPEAAEDMDPVSLFREWFEAARESGLHLPEAFSLATATPDGRPSVRMLLLKAVEPTAFRFFTNYDSRKARELEANPQAAMCFHWNVLERQVRVEGPVRRASQEASEAYFGTRSRGSRIGAWASRQSRPLAKREELAARVEEVSRRFEGREVPLPPFWGGYELEPRRMEFWQGRADRLHDRLVFERADAEDPWSCQRLYP